MLSFSFLFFWGQITLYHFDHPQVLESFGGWTHPKMIDLFVDFARFALQTFGDRVRV